MVDNPLTWLQDQGRNFNSWLGSVFNQPKPTIKDAVQNQFNPNSGHEYTQIIAQAMTVGPGLKVNAIAAIPAATTVIAASATPVPQVDQSPTNTTPRVEPQKETTSPAPVQEPAADPMAQMMNMFMTMMMLKMMVSMIPTSDGSRREEDYED